MGLIAAAPALTPTTLLEHLQEQKPDQHRRALHGPTPELMVPLVADQPGEIGFCVFTKVKRVEIILRSAPFPHLLAACGGVPKALRTARLDGDAVNVEAAKGWRWPVHSRDWLAGTIRSRKQLLEFISGLLSITQDFGKQPRTQRFTRMNRDYSSSAVGMSQKMMTSLNSQYLKANLPKCQDERLACDSGVC